MKKTTKNVKAVPDGFGTVTPYLVVDGADELIQFIEKGLNGKTVFIMRRDDNKVSHATVRIGNSMIMISDTMHDMKPELAMLYLYVEDADAIFKSAIDAHAEEVQPMKDQFYGDRTGAVKDRWGNKWWIATQREKVEGEELEQRAKEAWKEQEHLS
ncbi:MAG: VOC family protein [Bacteroidota bacterium]